MHACMHACMHAVFDHSCCDMMSRGQLRKVRKSDWHRRLATLDELEPLQQLTRLTQLGTEGNPCCTLHPVSRFRIEVLARHSTNLQQIDSHKVTQALATLTHTQVFTCCMQPTCQSTLGTASLPWGLQLCLGDFNFALHPECSVLLAVFRRLTLLSEVIIPVHMP